MWEMFSLAAEPWDGLSPAQLSAALGAGQRLPPPGLAVPQLAQLLQVRKKIKQCIKFWYIYIMHEKTTKN